ncbi:hypothetical protein TRAPUB_5141 [Trametes pubescens]|uniref:Uncharacterized protein n=1 Tax=Trametes pubescens TaxID=154538 RepID=A0A1M2V9F7_TRAPU|nr:hypothetical protein TRAPUB_5141 [Trametes pubescens]
MDALFSFTANTPVAYTAPEYTPLRADEFDTIMLSTDPILESLFDFDRWAADYGVAPIWNDFAYDAPDVLDAPNAFEYVPQDEFYPSYSSQDAPAPAFDAFASFVASSVACGWADRDHVTTFGPDGTAPLPYPFVSPVDICDLVPFVPPSASQLGDDDNDEEPEDVAEVQPEYDMTPEQTLDAWFAELGQQELLTEAVAVIDEPVNEYVLFAHLSLPSAPNRRPPALSLRPELSVKPNTPRPCMRRRPDHDDTDIYPAPSKKCARHPHCSAPRTPAHPGSSPIPRSQSPALDKSTLPEAIVVVRAAVLCPMPRCTVLLSGTDESAWRRHVRVAHHAELCAETACAAKGSCRRPCPLPACGVHMQVDSLGRHLLNKHIGVLYRCPVCGLEKVQRKYAVDRHIRTCLRNNLDA